MQGKNLPLEVYVVVNRAMSGREAMGIFSSAEKAQKHMDRCAGKTGYLCHIERSFVRGYYEPPHHVFAAHTYDPREDVHVLEGIYSELSRAESAAGQEGKIVEFSIDVIGEIQIFMNE